MPRSNQHYVCQSCGAVTAKWAGRCDSCGTWNTLVAETVDAAPPGSLSAQGKAAGKARPIEFSGLNGEDSPASRFASGNVEFDRACGGGLVKGSAVLIGGDPGVGKSTLLLQVATGLSRAGQSVAYISGEEASNQIRLRAKRLSLTAAPIQLASATALRDILASLKAERPDVVIIDSIQTIWSDALPGTPGSVTQMRACSQDLIRFAKTSGAALILVGHVTKDGQIAGPRVVEHMVDAVLYFEAETGRDFRLLRAVKNRFGAAHEIGVFEMTGSGLVEVENPSALFMSGAALSGPGVVTFAGMEGTRPVLVDIEALVSPSTLAAPRRAVVGWDSARLSMLLAVLDTRCGMSFGRHDVFLNVAGGLRIREPAADLAAAAALCSALFDCPAPRERVYFGEVALSGQVRPVSQVDARLREAGKLGFTGAIAPEVAAGPVETAAKPGTGASSIHPVESLNDLIALIRQGAP